MSGSEYSVIKNDVIKSFDCILNGMFHLSVEGGVVDEESANETQAGKTGAVKPLKGQSQQKLSAFVVC